MSVTFLGTKSIGSVAPVIALTLPALNGYLSSLLAQAADLASRLNILAQMSVDLAVPSVPAAITAALTAITSQLTSIAAGMLPTASAAIVGLNAELAGINLSLAAIRTVVDTITLAASAGGVHAFAIDSTPATVGGELAALVSGGINGGLPTARIQGVALVTESPATFSAMSKVFLVA